LQHRLFTVQLRVVVRLYVELVGQVWDVVHQEALKSR
jgi:hypothetical protein